MTSAIKPPGFGAPIEGIGHAPSQAPEAEAPARVQAPATPPNDGPNAALVEQLRQGVLTSAQVVDALVSRTLEHARAQGLPAAEEAGLEHMLRSALATDPTLIGLRRELDR